MNAANLNNANLETTSDVVNLLKKFEGFSPCAYWDKTGRKWTIGYGHTATAERYMRAGKCITEPEAARLKLIDLENFKNCVKKSVSAPMTVGMLNAATSFAYNTGCSGFRNTEVFKHLDKGNYQASADALPKYNRSGGKVLAGLTKRRAAERDMFLSGAEKLSDEQNHAPFHSPSVYMGPGAMGLSDLSGEVPHDIAACIADTAAAYHLNYEAVLAQWALESRWGKSTLVQKTNNPFNIKGQSGYKVVGSMRASDKIEGSNSYYRKYATMCDGIDAYGNFIASNPRYKGYQAFENDTTGYVQHLKNAGYATDTGYVAKIVSIVDGIKGTVVGAASRAVQIASEATWQQWVLLSAAAGAMAVIIASKKRYIKKRA